MTAMNMKEALAVFGFSNTFITCTLFRLGLNVSTTRAILSEGDAGNVVETFGNL